MKFRKKPVTVDAWRVTDLINRFALNGLEALPEPVCDAYENGVIDFPTGFVGKPPDRIDVITMEGIMQANHGWWLIRGVAGELYPCEGAIFSQTYEAIPDESA